MSTVLVDLILPASFAWWQNSIGKGGPFSTQSTTIDYRNYGRALMLLAYSDQYVAVLYLLRELEGT